MKIRQMKIEDIAIVQKIASLSYKDTYESLLPLEVQLDFLELSYGTMRLQQRMKSSEFYVAEIDGRIIGYINFTKLDKLGNSELMAIYIVKTYHRQKVGTHLVKQVEKNFPDLKSITINMEAGNEVGMKFITALRFYCIEQFIDDFQGVYLHMKRLKLFI
ncbi:MAG: GNAT family N-acetyltransferase [Kurthia sp.]|nr:GNAT family N-acetyltransferase [Candidatus Kurthia equi]